jgi:galacturonosyltransferase
MKEKGVDELFYAARRLKNELGDAVSFAVAGGFEESYSEIVKELSDEGVIEYLGFVKDVAALYRDCHAVVLPSYHEGLSNVLIEGAATGRALITTSVHGCLETVTDESGILVPPSDADALYFALRSFHGFSYEEKRDMGLSGRAHVEKSFDRADVVTFTLNALRERLDGQGHKTHKKRRD